MNHAPVALFVYNRAENTRRTLEALAANNMAPETQVYVFSDGGKDKRTWAEVAEVRRVVKQFERKYFKGLTLVERPMNWYLERNVMEGINQVFLGHDRIIVLEDDIVVGPRFLEYMNLAFDLYRDIPNVMHVSGFTNLNLPDVPFYFTPHMSGWGWGTWRDRWENHFHHFTSRAEALAGLTEQDMAAMQYGGVFPCLNSLNRKPIPWDICWELAIYRAGGLCLTPGQTLVRNIGLNNGTHFRSFRLLQYYEFDREPQEDLPALWQVECPQSDPDQEALFAEAIRDWGIRYTWLGHVLRFVYRLFCRKRMQTVYL